MSLLPRRVMLRRWFFSLRLPFPVLAIDFLDRHSEKLRKRSQRFAQFFSNVHRGTVIWRAAHSYMSLCKHFVKVSKMHEIVHMVDEILWKLVDNFCKIDEDV